MKILTKLSENKRRIFYGCCFFLFVMIDWVKNSRDGTIWTLAVNLTGLIMVAILAVNLKWKNERKLPYILWLIFWLISSVAAYFIWEGRPESVYAGQFLSGEVNVGALGVITLRMIRMRGKYSVPENSVVERKDISRKQKRTEAGSLKNCILPVLLWVSMSFLMFFSRYEANIWPLWFLWMFGIFYLLPMSKTEKNYLLNGCIDGIIFGFFALQIYAYGFRPYDEVRYLGAFNNCNMNALFYLVTYVVLLYRIFILHGKSLQNGNDKTTLVKNLQTHRGWLVIYYILAGGMLSFMQFTMTRTAILVAIVITFIYGICVWLVFHHKKWKQMIGQWLVLGCTSILLVPAVYMTIRYLPTILHHPVWFGAEYSIEKVHSFDPSDSDKYVSFEEFLEDSLQRFPVDSLKAKILNAGALVVHAAEESMQAQNTGAASAQLDIKMQNTPNKPPLSDDAGSGAIRLEIFKQYGENLNFTGHTLEEGRFQITESYAAWHAQNLFLQILFFYGIPAGILSILLLAWMGLRSLKLIFKGKKRDAFFTLLVLLTFMGYGLLEAVWYPGQMILFLLFMSVKFLQSGNEPEIEAEV